MDSLPLSKQYNKRVKAGKGVEAWGAHGRGRCPAGLSSIVAPIRGVKPHQRVLTKIYVSGLPQGVGFGGGMKRPGLAFEKRSKENSNRRKTDWKIMGEGRPKIDCLPSRRVMSWVPAT